MAKNCVNIGEMPRDDIEKERKRRRIPKMSCILCEKQKGCKRLLIVLLLPKEIRNQPICEDDYQDLKKCLEPFLLSFVKIALSKLSEQKTVEGESLK